MTIRDRRRLLWGVGAGVGLQVIAAAMPWAFWPWGIIPGIPVFVAGCLLQTAMLMEASIRDDWDTDDF